MYVPVVDINNKPLMPTTCSRAKRWIKTRKATPFWKKGIFCVRLNVKPSDDKKQNVIIGIDPGSKKEGYTLKSASHTFLNIQADARTGIKEKLQNRRELRRSRRFRNTPYRKCRRNRTCLKNKRLPPSTKARWDWKLRIINWLSKLYPITNIIVEDIKVISNQKNRRFSILEIGKNYFYNEIKRKFILHLIEGYETAELRNKLGLIKLKNKLTNDFHAHCVDSWVIANSILEGKLDNKKVNYIKPLIFHRRQLHVENFIKGGIRKKYGSMRSLGFTRGSIVKHKKYNICLIGGTSKNKISLHSQSNNLRLCQNAKIEDITFLSYNSWSIL